MNSLKNIIFLRQVAKSDVPFVGQDGVNLSEAFSLKIPIRNCFFVTPRSFSFFGQQSRIKGQIELLLQQMKHSDMSSLAHISSQIRSLISNAAFPNELAFEIISAYQALNLKPSRFYQKLLQALKNSDSAVTVSTKSATVRKEFENIRGESNLLLAVKSCWQESFSQSSLFSSRSTNLQQIMTPVSIMEMSQTQATAFVLTQKQDKSPLVEIKAVLGLGSLLSSEKILPDVYEVDKNSHRIVFEIVSHQKIQQQPLSSGGTTISPLSKRQGQSRKLTIGQIGELSKFAQKLQQHLYFPQLCEFAISKNRIFLVSIHQHQAQVVEPNLPAATSPRQTFAEEENVEIVSEKFTRSWDEVSTGVTFSPGIKIGHVKFVRGVHDFSKLNPGDVLVVSQLSKEHVNLISKAGAVISQKGSKHDIFSMLVHNRGIPHLQVHSELSSFFNDNQLVMVSASEGKIFKSN